MKYTVVTDDENEIEVEADDLYVSDGALKLVKQTPGHALSICVAAFAVGQWRYVEVITENKE